MSDVSDDNIEMLNKKILLSITKLLNLQIIENKGKPHIKTSNLSFFELTNGHRFVSIYLGSYFQSLFEYYPNALYKLCLIGFLFTKTPLLITSLFQYQKVVI